MIKVQVPADRLQEMFGPSTVFVSRFGVMRKPAWVSHEDRQGV